MLKDSGAAPFNHQTITERSVISCASVYDFVKRGTLLNSPSCILKTAMPSTKSYCRGNLWLKKGKSEVMESVISDFRDLLHVNPKEAVEEMTFDDILDCDRSPRVDDIDSEISLRACMCPTADPFRKSASSSSSYGLLMDLIEQGNLIKEAVRRLKTSPCRNKQLKRLDRCR